MRLTIPFSTICAFIAASGLPAVATSAPPVDFQRQVQPILSEHCLLCHGVDQDDRQGGLRLDIRSSALTGGESGVPAIVPGHTDAGELIR